MKPENNKNDKLNTAQPVTGSFGISSSANLTTESKGMEGDNSNSLFPHLKQQRSWKEKTTEMEKYDK